MITTKKHDNDPIFSNYAIYIQIASAAQKCLFIVSIWDTERITLYIVGGGAVSLKSRKALLLFHDTDIYVEFKDRVLRTPLNLLDYFLWTLLRFTYCQYYYTGVIYFLVHHIRRHILPIFPIIDNSKHHE